ncbi:MAG: hypothetical protein WCD79_08775 [Chthoniobacteraceae bacterium]
MTIFTSGAEISQQTPPIAKGQRVFTAGHSFHVWVAPLLDEMARSAGIEGHEVAGVSSIGGSTVLQHWNVPDTQESARKGLMSGQVDVLTLSPIWLPDEGIGNFVALGLEHNPDIRITVQEFWLPNDTYRPVYPLESNKVVDHDAATMPELRKQHALYFNDVDNHTRDLNAKSGRDAVLVVPAGQAVLALREKIVAGRAPGLKKQAELFRDSWGHPAVPIEVLSGYCHFAVIYRRSPVGLPVARGLAQMEITAEDMGALNLLLQELAWDAVIRHPLSGVLTL